MISDEVRRVADTIMYEGYVLYPYRASAAKNRSRWQFGVLMPPAYLRTDSCERTTMRTECLVECGPSEHGPSEHGLLEGGGQVTVEVTARFLQVQRRGLGGAQGSGASWDEAVEREVTVTGKASGEPRPFTVPGGTERSGNVTRTRRDLTGIITATLTELPGPWGAARLAITLSNETPVAETAFARREDALPFALVAAHLVITVSGGRFLSLTDPPEWASQFAASCSNEGCWPVLAGSPDTDCSRTGSSSTGTSNTGTSNTVLASPVILPDYPSVAAESAGELYDGTEIDEILTLRTLALTDAEKAEARATDPRAAALIDRVESVGADSAALGRLHGTWRPTAAGPSAPGLAPEPPPDVPWWNPEADASVSPTTDVVQVAGRAVAYGSRVRLLPRAGGPGVRRADAQDMFLTGREAVVEAVLYDVDDDPYLAVSLVDDPGADIRSAHGRFLYFTPDEVEPC